LASIAYLILHEMLGDLAEAALEFTANLQLGKRCLVLARAIGVPEGELIKSDDELFSFMNS